MTTPRTDNLRAALAGLRQQVEIGADTQTRESILRMLDKVAALASPSPEPDWREMYLRRAEWVGEVLDRLNLAESATPDDVLARLTPARYETAFPDGRVTVSDYPVYIGQPLASPSPEPLDAEPIVNETALAATIPDPGEAE